MGFRFYRRVSIAPGFRLNLSKRGVSTSFGRRVAHFTVGTRGTVGLPGTGMSYSVISTTKRRRSSKKQGAALVGFITLLIIGVLVWKLL
jgi:Protein of unknown function (DUF4236)